MRCERRNIATECVVVLVLLVGISCSGPTEPEPYDFRYPLAVGDQWVYDVTMTKDFNDDRPTKVAYSHDAGIRVIDSSLYKDGIYSYDLVEFMGAEWDESADEWNRFVNLDDGLYQMLSQWKVGLNLEPKPVVRGGIVINDHRFESFSSFVHDLFRVPLGVASAPATDDEEFHLVMPYPLRKNLTWQYRDVAFGGQMSIEKRVMGKKTIEVPAGEFHCIRIDWVYVGHFDDVHVSDYFSDDGLVLRRIVAENIMETDYTHPYGGGEVYTGISEFSLQSFTQNSE